MLVIGLMLSAAIAYASRGTWRPWVEALQRPAIPVATPFTSPTSTTLPRPASASTTTAGGVATTTRSPAKPPKPVPATTTVAVTDPFEFSGPRPVEMNLAVPFMLQAPKQNWDMPYQEACEEASLLMTVNFLNGRSTDFSPDESDRLILDLVDYETRQGDPPDVTLSRIADIARNRYGLRTRLTSVTSIDQIKNAVANGYPVIIPASGKALKNPNFRNGGPPYHMVVVKGYLSDGRIITNDPGTRKGKEYVYGASLFLNAIHDWNDGDVPNGDKVALVLLPKK